MTRLLSLVAVALLIAGCTPSTAEPSGGSTPPPTEDPSIVLPSDEPTPGASGIPGASHDASPDPTTTGTTTVRAYFFLGSFVDNAGLVPVLREIPATKAVGAAAIQALLDGPNAAELGARPAMYTNVPDRTRLLGLTIDNGVATVNLSKEFESVAAFSSGVGSVAQVVYTLTQFPTVARVAFEIDGVPRFFGGGGVASGSVSRDDYRDQLPAIFVDRPAWGGAFASPARLVGVADTFEATFQAEILDGAGRTVATSPVNATCGSGCFGTFDVTMRYSVDNAGWGTLRVFERSSKDGSPTNLTEYPIWLGD